MKFILKKPIVSEKAMSLDKFGQYVFSVDCQASSAEIKKEIERLYKVGVVRVNIINHKGKVKRWGRSQSRRPNFKKAIVSLKAGQKIDVAPR